MGSRGGRTVSEDGGGGGDGGGGRVGPGADTFLLTITSHRGTTFQLPDPAPPPPPPPSLPGLPASITEQNGR